MNILQTELTWAQLKALNHIYIAKKTKAPLFANAFLLRLKTEKRLLKYKSGNLGYIEGTAGFPAFFRENFLPFYEQYMQFFAATGVESDGRRAYSLYDLQTLIYIWKNKETLTADLTTERTFSAQLFKGMGSKYLENNQSVMTAVLKVLGIDKFPKSDPKDQKWRLVIDCPNPERIVLCENLAPLKFPDTAIILNTELWYVGGNNTRILENLSADKLQLPIFYMCDWDYDGLRIYEDVLKIIAAKQAEVRLLLPYDLTVKLPVNSPYHNSKWKHQLFFSGLNPEKYFGDAVKLIVELIDKNQWIEEESQDLETMLVYNKALRK